MNALYTLVDLTLTAMIWLLVIWAILGWLITFNVISSYNQFVYSFMRSVDALFAPHSAGDRRDRFFTDGADYPADRAAAAFAA